MAEKKKNDDGIDYSDVKRFAKVTGVNVVSKKKAAAVMMVLDGIVAHYEKARAELSLDELEGPELEKAKELFEDYKSKNNDMLKFFNDHKEYEPPAEPAEEPESEGEIKQEGAVDEKPEQQDPQPKAAAEEGFKEGVKAKVEVKDSKKDKKGKPKGKAKDLAGTKDGIKKAKAEAEKKKAEAAKKKAETKKTVTSRQAEKDEYGFVVGSKKARFAEAIGKKPCTMFEIRKMDWNDRMAGFYDTFGELQKKGLASKDDKGQMSMVKNKK